MSPHLKERKCDRWRTRRFRHVPRGMTGSPNLKVKVKVHKGVMLLKESHTLETTTRLCHPLNPVKAVL